MKVIFINRPLQDSNTKEEDIQYIDGDIKHWCVKTMKLRQDTIQEWLVWLQDNFDNNPRYKEYEGVYLYDVIFVDTPEGTAFRPGIMARFDYIIKEKIKK